MESDEHDRAKGPTLERALAATSDPVPADTGPAGDPLPVPRPGLVKPVRCDPSGEAGPTRYAASGPDWRRSSRGLYVPADVELTLEQRIYEAAVVLPECGLLTGWAALAWRRARWFDGDAPDGTQLPVTIGVMGRCVNDQPGIRASSEFVPPRHRTVVDGLPVAVPVRAVGDLARYAADDLTALKHLDMAAYSDQVSRDEMSDHAAEMVAHTGIERLRTAAAAMEENVWSPMEVEMYDWWTAAGLAPPLCNHPVFDLRGQHIATPDLFDPRSGLAGEYEGLVHLDGRRRADDVGREAGMRRVGVVTMVASDRADPFGTIVPRIRQAHGRATSRAVDRRLWTLTPPPWWTSTLSVADRRSLNEGQRRRLLAHRAA